MQGELVLFFDNYAPVYVQKLVVSSEALTTQGFQAFWTNFVYNYLLHFHVWYWELQRKIFCVDTQTKSKMCI